MKMWASAILTCKSISLCGNFSHVAFFTFLTLERSETCHFLAKQWQDCFLAVKFSTFQYFSCLWGSDNKLPLALNWKEPGVWQQGKIFYALRARSLNVL